MQYQGIFEGKLLWSGHKITEFTIRELCNMAFYHHIGNAQQNGEDEPTVEEQIELFEEKIGQRISAEAKAEEKMRATLIARGIDPDAVPELSPELAAKMEQDGMRSDQDIFFSGNLDKEFKGRQLKGKDYEIDE